MSGTHLDPYDLMAHPEKFIAAISPALQAKVEDVAAGVIREQLPEMVGRMLNHVVSERVREESLRQQFDEAIKAEVRLQSSNLQKPPA